MTDERWLPVPGYEGAYEVSDLGRVRGLRRRITRSNGVTQWFPGRTVRQQPNGKGRPVVRLYRDNKFERVLVHRLVAETFLGPAPKGMECCHGDDDPLNNRLSNLRWDTRSGNQRDRIRLGTHHMSSRTHCKSGHLLDGENVSVGMANGRPFRRCKECARENARSYRARLRGAA